MGELSAIKNFVQLTPLVGTAGQPTKEQFGDIAAAGYVAVINLSSLAIRESCSVAGMARAGKEPVSS